MCVKSHWPFLNSVHRHGLVNCCSSYLDTLICPDFPPLLLAPAEVKCIVGCLVVLSAHDSRFPVTHSSKCWNKMKKVSVSFKASGGMLTQTAVHL